MHSATRPGLAAVAAALTLAACSGSSGSTAAPAGSTAPSSASTSPSPTATPVVATCPLTGVPPAKGQNRKRVALAVKIDNVNDARPQSGLDHADLVVEETVEGGLTRLFAVFQCEQAPDLGPVRSARTSDGDLLRLLRGGAIFGYSGSNGSVGSQLAARSHAVLLSYDANFGLFHRSSSRPAPHNVYTSSSTLVQAGLHRSHTLKPPAPIFTYADTMSTGRHVHHLGVSWSGYTSAAWDWQHGTWVRTQNGTPDTLADGNRVHAANVLVMSIAVANTGLHDVLGNPSPDDVVTGKGKVWVLRNGRVVRGTWSRPNAAKPMTLRDKHGKVIPLHPGKTWVELLPRPNSPHLS